MSNVEREPRETAAGGRDDASDGPVRELLAGRPVALGGPRAMRVTRTLPDRRRRMVGAWCFADLYGPETAVMNVPPHPHTGLQTVSWLLEGEVLHRDSLGSEQVVRPGRLNLMTAGRGVSHSEESARGEGVLHGVQLWVALPGADRDVAPAFDHHPELPVLDGDGATVTVVMGELAGLRSPARAYTPLLGAQVDLREGAAVELAVNPRHEYAVLALSGAVEVEGAEVEPGPLLYLGSGRAGLSFRAPRGARAMLIGGEPFDEEIVMWWNFVGRSHDDILRYRKEWARGTAFGTVPAYDGAPLPAPPLPTTLLKPRGRRG
ncbi:pirin family protein [Sphaerisporangium sp. TRM90804]|uniref:pirin family protein n=1 Tax=Sphaerisporangium sp. TRM90804 TaxID=3031113 RepID=UPI00244755BD|nr:pirin family protein [Sphaerisporangium sp. TRM90804]MDH2427119.1 pirin family protein [Sphaerisporangium sp. TRM90804]